MQVAAGQTHRVPGSRIDEIFDLNHTTMWNTIRGYQFLTKILMIKSRIYIFLCDFNFILCANYIEEFPDLGFHGNLWWNLVRKPFPAFFIMRLVKTTIYVVVHFENVIVYEDITSCLIK